LMIQLKSYTVSTGCSWFFIGLLADSESKWWWKLKTQLSQCWYNLTSMI
jgi:hypothetical protein